jgi:hypothetical protein
MEILGRRPGVAEAVRSMTSALVILVARVLPGKSASPTKPQPLSLSPWRALLIGRHRLASARSPSRLGVVAVAVELIRHLPLVAPVAAAAGHTR